ncbi:MAG: hypothetical protein AMXMBFR33_43980 [Candidatus Xenobia bacterium]
MEQVWSALLEAQSRLEGAGIQSAVIGGIAVAVWGLPRATQDVDLKVLLTRAQADRLLGTLFPQGCPAETRTFLQRNGILFVQQDGGVRVDYLLSDTSFDRSAIERRVEALVAPEVRAQVCTAEDLIVYKLLSTRPRDYEDAVGIVARQRNRLDVEYVRSWLGQFEQALDDSELAANFERLIGR